MKTILLADDEAHLRRLVRTTIESSEYRILEAANGTEALSLANGEHPDLVVLDWMMPGMPGIEVARALRENPDTSQIPIILLTGMDKESERQHGYLVGADAYMAKPFGPLELLDKVDDLLRASGPALQSRRSIWTSIRERIEN